MKVDLFFFKLLLLSFLLSLGNKGHAQVHALCSLQAGNLVFQQTGDYVEISFEGCSYTTEIGNPQLPVIIETFVVPYNAVVAGINVTVTSKEQIPGNYFIYPAQPPRILDGSEPPPFVEPNPDVYNASTPYPDKTVELVNDGYLHGYHVVTVMIYPIEYTPVTGEIYLKSYSYTIHYTLSNHQIDQPAKQSAARAALTQQFIQSQVKNNSDVETFKNPNVQIIPYTHDLNRIEIEHDSTRSKPLTKTIELVPDYIIITNEELKPTFQTLANWKTKKGVSTIIKTVEEIEPNYRGTDLQEKIREYLKECYSIWGAGLFVLLGGDVNVIPARMNQFGNTTGFHIHPTDLYYATVGGTWNANSNTIFGESMDSVDNQPDFFLGRASVENSLEAQVFVNKVINYEKYNNISTVNYVINFLCMVGFAEYNVCEKKYYNSFEKLIKGYADEYLLPMNKWYLFENHDCSDTTFLYKPYKRKQCGNDLWVPYSGEPDSCLLGNQELDRINALSCLNSGGLSPNGNFHLIYHLQHSNVKVMGTTLLQSDLISNEDVDNLNNGNHLQILFSNGCLLAAFTQDCIAEHYLNNPHGGGVAFIGNSDNGNSGQIPQFNFFCRALYDNTIPYNLGFVFQKATPAGKPKQDEPRRRLHLLGDPEMPVWTDTPQTLAVAKSSSVNPNGQYSITVTLNTQLPAGDSALICLQKGDEGYATKKIPSLGSETFTFTPNTSGNVDIT